MVRCWFQFLIFVYNELILTPHKTREIHTMRIFVTGATGNVGPATIRLLAARGHELLVVGRRPNITIAGAEYRQCDITDYDRIRTLMDGYEAVVHLAALGSPGAGPGRTVFHSNACGTYTIYEAAAANGIRRVVCASSINAVGYFFGRKSFRIQWLPIDEEHPVLATDPYSFAKQVVESTGRYFWEREGISGTCLRLPAVWRSGVDDYESRRKALEMHRIFVEQMLEMPDDALKARLLRMHESYDALRRKQYPPFALLLEQLETIDGLSVEELYLMNMKANFWASLDDRDCASAIEKSLEADYEGCHTLFVNSSANSVGMPVKKLAELFIPAVTDIRPQTEGDTCLVSIKRARQLIGFNPVHQV
jgi:NAD(P)-dependent dehydrogenase (short-subunit alcohol dehydrogenase family)